MLLVGNIIIGTVCSQTTDLQVALEILMRRNKLLISELAKYSACCSYDEVRLFRYSAAVHVAENFNEVDFGADDNSTIKHCIIDNFDAEISSPNCKACVHCLAMIMAEVRPLENFYNDGNVPKKRKTIKRQPLKDRSKPVEYNVQLGSYDGPRNPATPFEQDLQNVPSLMLLASQVLAKKHAENNDFSFSRDPHIDAKFPEYNGYNTRIHRQAESQPKPYTEVSFVPLIDQPGIYNSTWTDIFIETTYMRLGQGPAGTVEMATENNQMVKWALSFAISGELSQQTLAMSGNKIHSVQLHHKKEAEGKT